jgi:hypothetical protein
MSPADDPLDLYLPQALEVTRSDLVRRQALGRALIEKDLEEALCEAFTRPSIGLTARRQAAMRTPNWQPKPGNVDLEVLTEQRHRVITWMEVKWGDSNLWNCVWDVAKTALAVRDGLCDRAYLVAGLSDQAMSRRPSDGAEFLNDGRWDTAEDVMLRYRDYWLYWNDQVKTRPLRLPDRIETVVDRRSGSLEVGGRRGWVLATCVRPVGEGWIKI